MKARCRIEDVEAFFRLTPERLEVSDALSFGEGLRSLIAVTQNHLLIKIGALMLYVKRPVP